MDSKEVHGKDQVEQGEVGGPEQGDLPSVHLGTTDGKSESRRVDAKDARKGAREAYLGDGVYSELTMDYLILRSGDGTRRTGPAIWLDAKTLAALLDFLKEQEVINSYDWTAPGEKLTD